MMDIPRDDRGSRNDRDDRGSRYSRDDRGSRNDRDESTTVTCSDCGTECTVPFVPRTNKPVYCSDCFRQHKPQDSGNDRYSRDDRGSRYSRDDRGSRNDRDESTTVTCSDCGTECTVPFVPRTNKPVYCSDCFRQHKHRIQEMIDIPEMTEVQDIPEMTEVQDIPEMTEVHDLHLDESLVEMIVDLENLEMINF